METDEETEGNRERKIGRATVRKMEREKHVKRETERWKYGGCLFLLVTA
jgi:hypothetical protein